mmetsp:Transcript_8402/g.37131  ORF Transcript_8402/g.37131 Transcript_8402/m.37131 type:complete len:271 (-) Transcript_8402:199-1011(-)
MGRNFGDGCRRQIIWLVTPLPLLPDHVADIAESLRPDHGFCLPPGQPKLRPKVFLLLPQLIHLAPERLVLHIQIRGEPLVPRELHEPARAGDAVCCRVCRDRGGDPDGIVGGCRSDAARVEAVRVILLAPERLVGSVEVVAVERGDGVKRRRFVSQVERPGHGRGVQVVFRLGLGRGIRIERARRGPGEAGGARVRAFRLAGLAQCRDVANHRPVDARAHLGAPKTLAEIPESRVAAPVAAVVGVEPGAASPAHLCEIGVSLQHAPAAVA